MSKFLKSHDLLVADVIYIGVVVTAAAATTVGVALRYEHHLNVAAVLGLCAVAAFGERGQIALRGEMKLSISLLPAIFAATLFGPLAAIIVFAASVAGMTRFPPAGRVAYLATRSLTGALAAGAAALAGDALASGTGAVVAAATAASVTAQIADAGVATFLYSLRRKGPWREAARDLAPVVATSVPLYGPAVAALVLAYRDISPWTLPLFFAPALAAQRWFLMYQEQHRLARDTIKLNERLEAANLSFASALVTTLDARDRYTAGHSAAVAVYARDIAERMGLPEEQQSLAHLCGLVHDIGKIGLPAGLLEKPGALTLDERREMQRHSEIGERILSKVETYAEIASVVRHHHERVDGQGYPDGICRDEIPLLARIIAVADAYNAMTSDRPYRDAMPTQVARLRLAQAVETQFDTAVVAAFEAILAGASDDYRRAKGDEFYLAVERDESARPVAGFVPTIAAAMAS
jgi:putative nucleotidyltransferase with HDIG domain